MMDKYQEAIEKLMNYVGEMAEFTKEQAPDIAREILVFGATLHSIWIAIFIGIMIFSIIMFLWGMVRDEDGWKVFGVLVFLISTVVVGVNYTNLVKIDQAPKLYVMDELRSKINNDKNN